MKGRGTGQYYRRKNPIEVAGKLVHKKRWVFSGRHSVPPRIRKAFFEPV